MLNEDINFELTRQPHHCAISFCFALHNFPVLILKKPFDRPVQFEIRVEEN